MATIYTLPDGQVLRRGRPFEFNAVAYPGNYFELSSGDDLAAIGVVANDDPPPPPRSLAEIKADLAIEVDTAAEDCRLKFITPGAGQALTYKEKAAEASRFVATSGAGAYPFLDAMVTAGRCADRAAAATLVLQAEAGWAQIGSQIEMLRERAKIQIAAATTTADAIAAAAVEWPA